MTLHWMIWSLASPSQLLLLALVLGPLLLVVRRPRAGRVFTLIGAAGLFFLGVLPTSHYLVAALESRFPQPQLPAHVTGIILLAGSERPVASQVHGSPQVGRNGGRHLTAQRLARAYPEARLVFSGGPKAELGKGPLETQTAVAVALFNDAGIAASRVTLDQSSRDTCDSPSNVRDQVHPRAGETWIVVTSAIHLPRTIACFRAAGWADIVPQPADYRVTLGRWNIGSFQIAGNLALLDDATHEWLGLAYYRLSGRTQEFFPEPRFDPPGPSP